MKNGEPSIQLVGEDKIDNRLKRALDDCLEYEYGDNMGFKVLVENEELKQILDTYKKVELRSRETGEAITIIQLICRALKIEYQDTFLYVVIENNKESSIGTKHPKSKILLLSMNWFLSLGYGLMKEKNDLAIIDKLEYLAEKHSFKYEIIYN